MTVYPKQPPLTLSDSHRQHLAESAIDPTVAEERGTFTAKCGKDVPQDGGKLPKKPGIVFPVHTLDSRVFYRLRSDNPGQLPKYMQPKGHPNRLDIHPRQHERIRRPGGMRYVTEGEKKVDAGVSRNVLMVGQSGVFNGQRDKGAALIDDWYELPLAGEEYAICYDSDIETNANVQLAADRLARLLKAEGSKVYITLLPPAPDGSKQGLDDFFANGGTVKQLELLTRPYDDAVVERVRLTRDQRLRGAIEALWGRWWATEWSGQGGYTDRDLALQLIAAARKHGKVIGNDLRVVKAWGPLMLGAKIGSHRTMSKSVTRLEQMGFAERDNASREGGQAGAFLFRSVARAGVKHYGGSATPRGATLEQGGDGARLALHPRASRLMWSRPAFTPKRGTVADTRKVRESKPPSPRPAVARLGKMRGAILDVLDVAGGVASPQETANALHLERPRDLVRFKASEKGRDGLAVMLLEAGILEWVCDVATRREVLRLTPNWLDRLQEARDAGGELGAEELAAKRYRDRSRAYHARLTPQKSKPSAAGLSAVERSHEKRAENIAEAEAERDAARLADLQHKRFAERIVYRPLRDLGRIRLGLLEEVLRDAGGTPGYALPAAKSLGCTVERLPEYGNERFVFAPKEWVA